MPLGEVFIAAGFGPVEEKGVDHLGVGVVVLPGVVCLGELLENRALGEAVVVERVVICAMAG